tara:strand:+ start:1085 stop:1327 length:243 start_codon:yes stop_codon:yes gene_type:complete
MKLSKKKLEDLTSIIRRRDEAFRSVGLLELRKTQQLNEAYSVEAEYDQFKSKMTEKYGKDVQVDMQTGEIVSASNDLKKV